MEDSPEMRIEFLRARLLAERTVSKTAKQRADELAQRVAELEEQLNIVTLQKRKAEKATANILAILENQGLSDTSEGFDSDSEQEKALSQSVSGDQNTRAKETVGNGNMRDNGSEAYSSSEIESSASAGRSLSWKSGKGSQHSVDRKKHIESARRRCSNFVSNGSSSPRGVGKSCRRIRRKETRLAVAEMGSDSGVCVARVNGQCSEDLPSFSHDGPDTLHASLENQEDNHLHDRFQGTSEENQVGDTHFSFGHDGGEDLKRALEHKAQLIGQYEAEEKAQREWEEKFRENDSCAQESGDPGNHSDVTEEREDLRTSEKPCSTGKVNTPSTEKSRQTANICEEPGLSSDLSSPAIGEGSPQEKKPTSNLANELPSSEFEFPVSVKAHGKDHEANLGHLPSTSYSPDMASNGSMPNPFKEESPSSGKSQASGDRNQMALTPHESSGSIGSVLEALQQAKSSLKQQLSVRASIGSGLSGNSILPPVPAARPGDRLEVPVGCPGLFRLPNEFNYETTSRGSYQGLGLHSGLASSARFSDEDLLHSRYMEHRPNTFVGDPFFTMPTTSITNVGSKFSRRIPHAPAGRPLFESTLDTGLPPSIRSSYPDANISAGLPPTKHSFSTYPLHSDFVPPTSSSQRFSSTFPVRESGSPARQHFSYIDDPNIYR